MLGVVCFIEVGRVLYDGDERGQWVEDGEVDASYYTAEVCNYHGIVSGRRLLERRANIASANRYSDIRQVALSKLALMVRGC